MTEKFNSKYPDIPYLRERAKKRIPKFAFEYLDGGCNSEINLHRNTKEIRDVQLKPYYLRDYKGASLETTLFDKTYSAPFGIAPIGLQGLMWPKASEILAKAAFEHNIPFILSTVGTASIETIADITEGNAWFQLYYPVEARLRNDIIQRAADANYPVLVLLSDTPTFGYRSKEIINGLSIPPKMTVQNMIQILSRPTWAFNTLMAGQPEFKTLKPYLPKGLSLKHLGLFMNKTFNGRLTPERIKPIRDKWKGKLVIKGITNDEDVEKAIALGLDGIIVSNHGGRQLDRGESTIKPLTHIAQKYKDKITVMMDSGIRTGPDIAATMASGADFTFLGRSFMYGVAALGKQGGDHTINILKRQLGQVMEQVSCEKIKNFPDYKL
ncbi:alpha-hydroxy acid oxidase [Seonamhaeicola aphaedonensis]|uniref:L-lactate dehydrogenase (Cytochrome) n=1 Tax=Seonamhaeicola aphaedonensis TaxID=1461338 RepID=A0A3D9HHI1_9FLAO|nr:alpha-hydroxy acid oxidase [Seonamhaeicola aphaedonensis]RED49012.1 L-lactate dehydrogenase (cytochrome) [Seonamhaeicola aphaedonensis]